MDESELANFRLRARVMLMEQLVLRNALFDPVARQVASLDESQRALKGWLDTNVQVIDRAYGAHFQDPAQTALYADEVREIADDLKSKIDRMVSEAKKG